MRRKIGYLHALMVFAITLGGIAGTLARYFLQSAFQGKSDFPWGTFAVNIAGSLLIGLIMRLAADSATMSPQMRGGLAVGFCGAFTTMSTFSYETVTLLTNGAYWRAGVYAGGSVLGSLMATVAGMALADRML